MLKVIAGLKYFNVHGPNEFHKGDMRSMVCKGYEQIRDTGRIGLFKSDRPEYGHGDQDRDFIYVKDAVDMTLFFMDHPETSGIY
ncbi:MAG: NAD-dependent epimerase/dehydratase family protein, partial [Gammaproteobacteria bacterium]